MRTGRPEGRARRTGVVAVVILALLALLVDRASVVLAQRWSARQIAAATSARDVVVHIDGFPFLTQLVSRAFSGVLVTASEASGDGLTLTDITLHASRVQLVSLTSVTAGQLDGGATLSYPELATLLRLPAGSLSYAGSGLLRVSTSIDVLATRVSVVALGTLTVAEGSATFRPTSAVLGDGTRLDPGTLRSLSITATMPDLLPGLAVTSASPTAAGVRVLMGGSNVTIHR